MNSLRKLLCFLAAVLFAAFALPASAADKLFSLNSKVYTNDAVPVLFGVIPSGTTATTAIVVLDFFNQSPGGNSVFNSIKVTVPPDVKYSIINTVTKNGGSCPAPAHTTSTPSSGPGGAFQLNSINGAKPNGHFCVYLAATSISNACAPSVWKGEANTGSSITGGVPFFDTNIQTQPYSLTQTVDGCEGTLDCGQVVGDTDPVLDGDPSKAITRGILNTDNTCTALIGYSLNLDASVTTNQITSFITFKNGQAFAVEYVLAWAPVPLAQVDSNSDGFPDYHPQVSWKKDLSNNDVFIPGQACVGTNVSDPLTMPIMPVTGPPYNADGTTVRAEMCIAGLEWQVQSDGKIQYLLRVIDQSDSLTKGP
jgi:hypothetical protein